jgi:hypothetical protein
MRFVRRAALALTGAALAGGLVTATSGAASAAPAPKAGAAAAGALAQTASAATCPAPGHRVKDSSSATVYLVGPGGRLYYFPDSSDYFGLYTSYSGITTVSSGALDACYAQSQGIAYALVDARLDKVNGTPDVFIYDASYGSNGSFRWITSQSVFDRYGFASSKIRGFDVVGPVGPNWS